MIIIMKSFNSNLLNFIVYSIYSVYFIVLIPIQVCSIYPFFIASRGTYEIKMHEFILYLFIM